MVKEVEPIAEGELVTTVGAEGQIFKADDAFLGLTVPMEKSVELLFASIHPLLARKKLCATVIPVALATVPSEQVAVEPNPIKSTMVPPVGQEPDNATLEEVSATLPAVPDMLIVPEASVVGRATPFVPVKSPIRKYPPAGMVPEKDCTAQDVPAAEAY